MNTNNRAEAHNDPRPLAEAILDALTAHTAALDPDGIVVALDASWTRVGDGPSLLMDLQVGRDYLHHLDNAQGPDSAWARMGARGIRQVLGGRRDHFVLDYPVEQAEGPSWFSLTVTPRNHESGGVVLSHLNVSDRKHAEQELAHQSLYDTLTGLPNRSLVVDRLRLAIERRLRTGACSAVLFVDLDGFQPINERFGHAMGDRLLALVARRLESAVRPGDTIGRFTGDTFAILCESVTGIGDATTVAERLRDTLLPGFELDGHELHVSACIGISIDDGLFDLDAETLLADTDAALAVAKRLGPDQIHFFDVELRNAVVERMDIETGLRRAVDRSELRTHYLPTIDLANGAVVGAEALVRWQHPERGLLSPAAFLDIAEASGAILGLGTWVLEEACEAASHWPEDMAMRVAVNLSDRQLRSLDLLATVEQALQAAGLAPDRLCLEVPEASVIDTPQLREELRRLRELGVGLAIDDFGAGSASLAKLRELPVDYVKIDRSFVRRLGNVNDDALVGAMIGLAHALDLVVVAEGVETETQHHHLVALGCNLAQGYLYSRPVPLEDLRRMLGRTYGPNTQPAVASDYVR